MVETRSSRRFAAFFLIAAFLVLAFSHWLKPVNHLALTAAAPFVAVVSGLAEGIGDTVGGVVEAPALRSQNDSLRKTIGILVRRNILLQQAAYENRLLTRMLRFDDGNGHMDFVTAQVIGSDPNSLVPDIIINRGSRDGLRSHMTVVDAGGNFVGSISDLTANAAKVLLMTSPSSSIGALDLQTRANGLVEGRYAGAPRLDYVVASSTLRPGDLVVTSGQLNLYPRNLLLGQIVSVNHQNDAMLQSAVIRPAADFQHLEYVQVIRNWVPSVPASLLNGH